MAFCTNCGQQLPDDIKFCTSCGAVLEQAKLLEPAVLQDEAPPEQQNMAPIPPAQQNMAPSPPTQQYAPAPPPMQQYAPPVSPAQQDVGRHRKNGEVVGTGAYFGMMFLFALPLIGLVCCIIFACVSKNQSRKNFAKANLIWFLVGVIICILLIVLTLIIGNSLINQITGGDYGSWQDFVNQFANSGY